MKRIETITTIRIRDLKAEPSPSPIWNNDWQLVELRQAGPTHWWQQRFSESLLPLTGSRPKPVDLVTVGVDCLCLLLFYTSVYVLRSLGLNLRPQQKLLYEWGSASPMTVGCLRIPHSILAKDPSDRQSTLYIFSKRIYLNRQVIYRRRLETER